MSEPAAKSTTLGQATFRGVTWTAAGQVARQALSLAVTIALARLLDPSVYGVFGMAAVFTGMGQLIGSGGFAQALIQRKDITEEHRNAAFWGSLFTGLALALAVAAAAPLIAGFYGVPELKPITWVSSLGVLAGALGTSQSALVERRMGFRTLAIASTVAVVGSSAVGLTMAWLGYGVWSLVTQALTDAVLGTAMLWLVVGWRPKLRISWPHLKELLPFGLNLTMARTVAYLDSRGSHLLLGKLAGAFELGVFDRSYSLMRQPISEASSVLTRVMFPALSSIQELHDRVARLYLFTTRCLAFFTFPIMIGIAVVAEPFVAVVLGPRWDGVAPVLTVLAVAGIGESIGNTVGWLYLSQGRTDVMFRWGLFAAAVRIASAAIGVRWGAWGVACAYTTASYGVLWYPGWAIPGRLVGLRFGQMLQNLWRPFAAAVLMGGAVLLVRGTLEALPSESLWALAIPVATGVVVYPLATLIINRQGLTEIRQEIVRRVRGA